MEEKKKYKNQQEEEKSKVLNEPSVAYTPASKNIVNQPKGVSRLPGQYSEKEFEDYLDAFENDLSKEEECFYTHDEVVKMVEKW